MRMGGDNIPQYTHTIGGGDLRDVGGSMLDTGALTVMRRGMDPTNTTIN